MTTPEPPTHCIRCWGTDDVKSRWVGPGVEFCKWCREALNWRDRALAAEERLQS